MKMQVACTNKILVIASMKENFRQLYVEWNPRAVSFSFKQFATNRGYYLTDAPNLDGDMQEHLDKAMLEIAPKIFAQELSELGIPQSNWPELGEFHNYIDVCHRPLTGDFGSEQLITNFYDV